MLIENNVFQVAAILGILKAGMSYVAIDADFPLERNRMILQDAECSLLLTNQQNELLAKEIAAGIPVRIIGSDIPDTPEDLMPAACDPGDNAITLYTSGSTGKPKGVLQSHRNMMHFIYRMTKRYPLNAEDKVAYFLSVAFSAHALPLLAALLNGCELKTFRLKDENFFGYSKWFRESGITFAMMIPSFLRHFLSVQTKKDKFPELHTLMLGGETLYRSDVVKAREVFGKKTQLVNIYASTEAYLMRSFPIHPDTVIKTNIVPIGYPVEDMDIEVVDENGEPVSGQNRGEIILKSPFISEGYWKRPELTQKDFSTLKGDQHLRIFKTSDSAYYLDGDCLVHVGRMDATVKLRGYRIDFGEIINILLQHENVIEAACAVMADPRGNEHLIAYYMPAEGKTVDEEILRASLVRMLPDYMIPAQLIPSNRLPKSNTGKLDTSALPEPSWEMPSEGNRKPPADELEGELVKIFEKVLKIAPIGTDDNFLKIGGNSLLLFVAFSEVEKKFNIKIDVRAAVDHPTIISLAGLIRKSREA